MNKSNNNLKPVADKNKVKQQTKTISICPIGEIDEHILIRLAKSISAATGLGCRIIAGSASPDYAYNKARKQYDSKQILKTLLNRRIDRQFRLIGVVNVDLYVPILKYVYGLAQLDGICGVVSLYRLYPAHYQKPSDPELLFSRLEKTAVHELGHTFGLTHCTHKTCVMYSSTKIEHTDNKDPEYCPTCFELFKWYISNMVF